MPSREMEASIPTISDIADAKEFSIDPLAGDAEGPLSQKNCTGCTSCTGPKCVGECVQKCLPPPPRPNCR